MIRGGPELAGRGSPWPSDAQSLLLQAAIGPDGQAEAAFDAWLGLVDLDGALDGGTFRLLPLLFVRLQQLNCSNPLMGRLKGVYRQAWCENHVLFNHLAPIVAALEAASITTMLLKGAPLALNHYQSHAARPMLDLDVAIHADQADVAQQVMEKLGWRMPPHFRGGALKDFHALEFKSPDGLEVDLHLHVMRETPYPEADAWFWRSAQPFDFCGVKTLQPRPTAMLLNTLLHGVRTNYEPPIRWIADAAMLLKSGGSDIDWDDILQFGLKHRVTHRLHLGLRYLADTYQLPIPPHVITGLARVRATMVERMENIIYLGPPQRLYRPKLFPLVDYWRFLRCRSLLWFLAGYAGYLQRQWRLSSRRQIPFAVAAAIGRSVSIGTRVRRATRAAHAGS